MSRKISILHMRIVRGPSTGANGDAFIELGLNQLQRITPGKRRRGQDGVAVNMDARSQGNPIGKQALGCFRDLRSGIRRCVYRCALIASVNSGVVWMFGNACSSRDYFHWARSSSVSGMGSISPWAPDSNDVSRMAIPAIAYFNRTGTGHFPRMASRMAV
jgi:hypothetical protein